ncbi:MAG: FtsX-like permease family protein [Candidatus Fimadaptatus sp.]|nr:FtsX-like permease family protein [Candidatus Fimadaptatus sp.]
MKSARRKNILRGIRQSLNRFISILFIVALGAGFLAGLSATSPDMFENADKYMDEYRMYDIDVKATLGLTDSDVDAIAQVDGVALVQPARVLDMVLVDKHDNELTTRVFALLDNDGATDLNQFELKEGRLPKAIDECAIQSSAGRYTLNAPQIGDTLTLAESSNDSASEYASSNTLRVVGIVESPMCISVEREPSTAGTGSVALQAFVRNEFLTMDFYTDCYLLVQDAAQLDTCSNEYTTLIDDMTAKLETLGDERASLRADELREQGKQKIDSAQAFMNSFESVIGTRTELAEDAAIRAKQTAAAAALINSNPELAQKLVATAKAVGDALSSASDDKENAQARIERLNADIADAQNALDEIGDGTWLVRTRADSVGYANYKDNVEKVSALCKVFPMFFFLVALLVALTTMTRLIEERRTQIGTLKALGYTDWQIFGEYILYSLSAAVLGCAIGFLGGFKLFPTVINSAYGMMYTLPPMDAPFRLDIALLVAPVTIGGILLATVWVCYSVCRSRPAPLMQPKAPAPGKRIFLEHIPALWKRMSFTQKVTCRNLFRYKKRLFMTIIGMAGCSALMLTGFGLRDSIDDIVYKQFGEIDLYQMSIVLNDANAIDNDAELKALLTSDSRVSAYMPYHSETGRIQSASGSESISLAVPENSDMLDEYIVLRERKSARPLALTDDGIILTEKLCEKLGISVGDAVTLENADGKRAQLCVDGISENYIASYAFLTANCYRDAYNSDVGYTTLLCLTDSNAGMDVLLADAIHCESVLYASASSTLMNTFNDSVKSIDAIVWVLILAAGMLSMVVNYNLTNVNICERKKEIATIRVLGFHEREVEKYIFRETNALSIMGSLIGLPVGIWLHSFVVRTVEVNSIMFGREIKPLSYAMAIAISLLFTFIINRIMSCSIRKVDMVESMKAND